jgi:HD-GYP domain-containing protein (c-di-GMP phosphodiesterase class II)
MAQVRLTVGLRRGDLEVGNEHGEILTAVQGAGDGVWMSHGWDRSRVFAFHAGMKFDAIQGPPRYLAPLLVSLLAAGALLARQRRARRTTERVAAAALETLLNAIEANDPETGRHVRRVASYALIIADAAGFDERQSRAIERVALFHDIGKIHEALFDIVHDNTKLSAAERREIATHPRRGAQVLAPFDAFYPELSIGVLSHHERWDGNGYPRCLRGTRIPLEARVVTIADTFDAITHNRRYRRGTSISGAFETIAEGRGTQFDPQLIDLVLLPPVSARLARAHVLSHRPRRTGRRAQRGDAGPDVSFRWRSESLGSSGVAVAHDVD